MSAYDLERFVSAQDSGAYAVALAEIRDGRKQSHWMWFVFPQIAGLGRSETARRYAISSLAEASEYLEHPLLGPRLIECAEAVAASDAASAEEIFGELDALKLRSSMTLFARATEDGGVFSRVLKKYFGGLPDDATERSLDHPDRLPPGE